MRLRRVAFAAMAIALAGPSGAQGRPTDALAWLTGCWERRTPDGVIEEQWSSAVGGMLLGFSRTVRRDSVTEYEFVRIYNAGADTLIYDAQPSRQARTEFRAVGPFEPEIVFANPAHDFPQRIVYRRVSKDSMIARIEGTHGGQTRTINFPYVRARCS
jgi:hypothetical protein